MSLNDIRLSPKIIVDLYANVLIEPFAGKDLPLTDVKYLGGNAKNILVVAAADDAAFIKDDELAFLTSILGACKLTVADVAIVNWTKLHVDDYKILLEKLSSQLVLLFDVAPVEFGLPMNFPPFQVQQFAAQKYMHAPALSVIEEDKELKKQLWNSLKQLFNI